MYYSCIWSPVIAKDLFSRCEGDVMNKATAADYRRTVTSRGGSRPAKQLVHDFLGRDYGFAAFEAWLAC